MNGPPRERASQIAGRQSVKRCCPRKKAFSWPSRTETANRRRRLERLASIVASWHGWISSSDEPTPTTHLQPHRRHDASAFPDALHPSPCQPRILAAWRYARLHFPSKCLGPTPWVWWVSWDLASSPPSAARDGGRQLPALAPCASRPRGFEWPSLRLSGGGGPRSLLLTAYALVLPWASAVNCAPPLRRRSCGLLLASSAATRGEPISDPELSVSRHSSFRIGEVVFSASWKAQRHCPRVRPCARWPGFLRPGGLYLIVLAELGWKQSTNLRFGEKWPCA